MITHEPTAGEYELAYQLLRPVPWLSSPAEHTAGLVAGYREGLIELLGPLLERLPEPYAEELRAAIAVMRGERRTIRSEWGLK